MYRGTICSINDGRQLHLICEWKNIESYQGIIYCPWGHETDAQGICHGVTHNVWDHPQMKMLLLIYLGNKSNILQSLPDEIFEKIFYMIIYSRPNDIYIRQLCSIKFTPWDHPQKKMLLLIYLGDKSNIIQVLPREIFEEIFDKIQWSTIPEIKFKQGDPRYYKDEYGFIKNKQYCYLDMGVYGFQNKYYWYQGVDNSVQNEPTFLDDNESFDDYWTLYVQDEFDEEQQLLKQESIQKNMKKNRRAALRLRSNSNRSRRPRNHHKKWKSKRFNYRGKR